MNTSKQKGWINIDLTTAIQGILIIGILIGWVAKSVFDWLYPYIKQGLLHLLS